jgi:hypothetical protein
MSLGARPDVRAPLSADAGAQSLEERKARTMIDWDSDDWGNRVTFAADGSWVADKHGNDAEQD